MWAKTGLSVLSIDRGLEKKWAWPRWLKIPHCGGVFFCIAVAHDALIWVCPLHKIGEAVYLSRAVLLYKITDKRRVGEISKFRSPHHGGKEAGGGHNILAKFVVFRTSSGTQEGITPTSFFYSPATSFCGVQGQVEDRVI